MPTNNEHEEFEPGPTTQPQAEEPKKPVELWFNMHACRLWEVNACRTKNAWAIGKMLTEKEFQAGLQSAKNVTSK